MRCSGCVRRFFPVGRARTSPVRGNPEPERVLVEWAECRRRSRSCADNRVRLTVEVPRDDVQHAVEHAASDLAGSVKIPGFRKGKVPMPVLLARVGRSASMTEAVESHIGGWFRNAAARPRIRPVAQPEYDYELPSSEDEDWSLHRDGRRPAEARARRLDAARGAGSPSPRSRRSSSSRSSTALRASVAELAPVEDRPARRTGDTLVVDVVGDDGEAQRDYVVELGSGRLVEEIERGARRAWRAGETKDVEFELARRREPRPSRSTVKEIKEKVLPPLDDELARAASEFDTLDELRADIEHAPARAARGGGSRAQFRAAAVDALVEAVERRGRPAARRGARPASS